MKRVPKNKNKKNEQKIELKTKQSLFKLIVSKSMGPDKIHAKILKYLLNENFTNVISKLFEECIENENYNTTT